MDQEFKEVKEVERRLRHLKPYLFEHEKKTEQPKKESEIKLVGKKRAKTIDDASSSDEEEEVENKDYSDNENGLEISNKAVDRGNKLTRAQLNQKLLRKLKQKEQLRVREEKRFNQSMEKLPTYIKMDIAVKNKAVKNIKKRRNEKESERQVNEKLGVVNKPAKIGKYNYKMKKIEFQTEDELSGNLRQLKPQGPGDLLLDRFDSIFRRRMLEPEEPLNSDRKRIKKAKYKWHQS